MVINEFIGEYAWLSNFYPSIIKYEGVIYETAEAAFQAQKCVDADEKALFIGLAPSKAKKLGKKVLLRPDWETVKDIIMYKLLWIKFTANLELKDKLLATGDTLLIEGNHWHDKYWGVCPFNGEPGEDGLNRLGELLMRVRSQLQKQ